MVASPRTVPDCSKRQWIILGAAVAIVIALVAAWTLINALIPGRAPIRAGAEVQIGESGSERALMAFPDDGWMLDEGATRSGQSYRFVQGTTELTVAVAPAPTSPAPSLNTWWEGAEGVIRAADPEARVDVPSPVVSGDGTEGLTGAVHGTDGERTAILFPAPSGGFAVRMSLRATDRGPDPTALTERIAHTVTFAEGGQDA